MGGCNSRPAIINMNKKLQEVIEYQNRKVTDLLIPKPDKQAEQLVELIQSHFFKRKIRGIELGTLQGATLAYVLENCPNVTMVAIEPAPQFDIFRVKVEGYNDRVMLLACKSDIAIKHWFSFGMGKVDFVWVDGDHEYYQVKKDIHNYLPLIENDGFIGGHDYHCPKAAGVTQAVKEIFSEDILHLGRDFTWWVKKSDV